MSKEVFVGEVVVSDDISLTVAELSIIEHEAPTLYSNWTLSDRKNLRLT